MRQLAEIIGSLQAINTTNEATTKAIREIWGKLALIPNNTKSPIVPDLRAQINQLRKENLEQLKAIEAIINITNKF